MVEAGVLENANWFKSSRSGAAGHCVEAAHLPGQMVGVRNSRDPEGTALVFPGEAWDGFLEAVQSGEFTRR